MIPIVLFNKTIKHTLAACKNSILFRSNIKLVTNGLSTRLFNSAATNAIINATPYLKKI
jgi:hypothetical protein